MAFTFIDRALKLSFFSEDPVEVKLYLGDALDGRIEAAATHYDAPHTLEEDVENLKRLVGEEAAEQLLSRAGVMDRLTVLELVVYIVTRCREEQGKKLLALTGAGCGQGDTPFGSCPMAS